MVYATSRANFVNDKITTAEEALERVGGNFEVQTVGLVTESGADVRMKKAVIRTDSNIVLGVVGNKYTPIQNSVAFAFFDTICKTHGATYEHGYLIDNGRQVILQAKIGDDWEARKGDVITNNIVVVNSHDGSLPFKAFFTPKRLWCINQLYGAIKSAVSNVSIRHTSNSNDKMYNALLVFNCAVQYFDMFKEKARQLSQKIVDQKMIDSFITSVFGDIESKNKNKQSSIDMVEHLIHSGKGNTGKSVWDLYNGVTEYVDHYRYNNKPNSDALNTASALLTGVGLKEKAWHVANSI